MSTLPCSLPNSNLYHAALTGNMELARESMAQGASPNYQEINRKVLQAAVLGNRLEPARYLLDNGADPNLKSADSLTPLMLADSGEMVRLLAKQGADPKTSDDGGLKAIAYYVAYDCVDSLRAWMEPGLPMIKQTKKLISQLLARDQLK